MAQHKYSFEKYDPSTMARVVGRSLPISTKYSIEICKYLRGKDLQRAKKLLVDAINLKKPIPFTRFNADMGHKKGEFASGRFAVKASASILELLESCEANAKYKGLDSSSLIIVHMNAHKGAQQWHYGRQRRRKMKRTHVELVVEETAKSSGKEKVASKPASQEKVVETK